ncbi:MAG: beta-propeller domain-containing protein [Methylococcales bacterium]
MKNKSILLFASSLLFTSLAQPVFAAKTNKLQPKKITSKLMLANLLIKHKTNRFAYPMMTMKGVDFVASTAMPTAIADTAATPVSHSDTNIQVAGVDESDSVKVADDGYIYQIHNNQIRVIKGFPIVELSETATIKFADENFYPTGIYVQNGKLVVLGSTWKMLNTPQVQPVVSSKMAMPIGGIWWGGYIPQTSQTRAFIFDMSDHANPKSVRDVAIDGDYLDSRRIGDVLYFVARTYPRYYMMGSNVKNAFLMKTTEMLPTIIDTKKGKTATRTMSVTDLSYLPDFVEPDYVVVASLNLQNPDKALTTKAYLGAGELVYSSLNNLYLSASKYNFDNSTANAIPQDIVSTQIYKFNIDKGAVNFAAVGQVPGTALNRFSMDEHGDYFRIATTTQNWANGTNTSTNALFVLDKTMQTVGELENLAQGERIYSTRFMGNRCYIVTFKQVDPLFAIDLSVPEKPFVAGELKIPGYSEYLHPYDENHLIGFGHDATTYNYGHGDVSIPLGLKMALFDVSDMNSPQELYSVKIGDKGTNTPLTYDAKSLYWDAEKKLFGFPVDLHELPKGSDSANPSVYGNSVWQGAYIYEVTPEKGFNLKAKLSQIPADVSPVKYEYGSYWDFDATNLFVDRILRIENNLYTLSNNQLNIYDLENFNKIQSLAFKP